MATREEIFAKFTAVTSEEAKKSIKTSGADVPAGKNEAGAVANAQVNAKNPDATPKLADTTPKSTTEVVKKSSAEKKAKPIRKASTRQLTKAAKNPASTSKSKAAKNSANVVQAPATLDPVTINAAEKETKERTLAVSGAQTPEELCDIVASFDTVPSVALGDTPGGKLASSMRMLLAGLSSRFDTYEAFEEVWKKQYKKVTRAYGVQEKFDVLLKEKMRLQFSESATVAPDTVVDLKKEAEKRKLDVNNVKTLDELYAVVASFEKIASTVRGADISGTEAVEDMKKKIEELSKLTSEDMAVDPTLIYSGVLEYGVNDKFKELVLEMVRQKEKIEKPDEAKDLEKIKVLEEQLVAARTAYAKKDYEETGVWKRLRGILSFSKGIESQKAETEKALYQGKLRELLDAKLKLLKQSEKEGDKLKQAMAAELQYFSIESKIKLYDAWTATKDEGSFMKIGKAYNGLVKKHPWISAGIGVSLMAASIATGGATPAALTALILVKQTAGSLGAFVTADTAIGRAMAWARERSIINQAEMESKNLKALGSNELEASADELSKYLHASLNNVDKDLQGRKVANRVQKGMAALLAGAFFATAAWNAYGKVPIGEVPVPGAAQAVAENGGVPSSAAAFVENPNPATESPVIGPYTPLEEPPVAAAEAPATGAEGSTATGAVAPAPVEAAPSPDVSEAIARDKFIEEFVSQDIKVAKGDSVWKISGRLADQLNLEGAERTHFIDSLKDKFGDVRLQEGQIINMGKEGIDKEFIENALGKSTSLTQAQMESITTNDATIAKYALENPNVTLTNESVDQILHSNSPVGVSASDVNVPRTHVLPSGLKLVPVDYTPDADDSTESLQKEVTRLNKEVLVARELASATAMQPRVEGWISPLLAAVPEGSSSAVTMNDFKKISIGAVQRAIESGSYADLKLTEGQFTNLKQFIQWSEKDGLTNGFKFADMATRSPKFELGSYITNIARHPKVDVGFMIGGRGGFSTSI